jgi:orotate phosphoribosyltransferase
MATEVQDDGRVQDVPYSAVQYVREQLGLQVCAIATLDDLVRYLQVQTTPGMTEHLGQVQAYRERYGVVA